MNDWTFLLVGYVLTVLIEIPVLIFGLSARHSLSDRLFAGLWLTACTYPTVVLVLPSLLYPLGSRPLYLAVAETFAPVVECLLFQMAFGRRTALETVRNYAAIVAANLLSFGTGEWLHHVGWI